MNAETYVTQLKSKEEWCFHSREPQNCREINGREYECNDLEKQKLLLPLLQDYDQINFTTLKRESKGGWWVWYERAKFHGNW